MRTYEIVVVNRSVKANTKDARLVRTSAGIDRIHVLFDSDEWLDFPVTATFAQSDDMITVPVVVGEVADSDDWSLEATCDVPWEVIDSTGPIRVTFQGTDEGGRHIITAKGAPLTVVEAGDVSGGVEPSDVVTPSELEQAYAEAMAAVNRATSMLNVIQSRIDGIVENAKAEIESIYGDGYGPATRDALGLVRVGDGLGVTEDGTLSVPERGGGGMTEEQLATLRRLEAVVDGVASYSYEGGVLNDAHVSRDALPVASNDGLGAVYPDGTTVTVDADGMIHANAGNDQVPLATTTTPGKVKPDGTTITVDEDGTIHGSGQGGVDIEELPFRVGYVGNSSYMSNLAYVIGDESDGHYRFPAVAEISSSAYKSCSYLRSVDFPACASVGSEAFYKCQSLVSVSFPSCTSIGNLGFDLCTYLSAAEFPVCSTIGNAAFANCARMSYADFPLCTSVGRAAFASCYVLSAINMPTCTSIGGSAFQYCRKLTSVTFPSCTSIESGTFNGCSSLVTVSLPSCSVVGSYAFSGCWSLQSIALPSCTGIRDYAFSGCRMLTRLDLTGVRSVPGLGKGAFDGTPISSTSSYAGGYGSIYVPNSLYISFRSAYNWSQYSSRMRAV